MGRGIGVAVGPSGVTLTGVGARETVAGNLAGVLLAGAVLAGAEAITRGCLVGALLGPGLTAGVDAIFVAASLAGCLSPIVRGLRAGPGGAGVSVLSGGLLTM
jgi:hypothetical protein